MFALTHKAKRKKNRIDDEYIILNNFCVVMDERVAANKAHSLL